MVKQLEGEFSGPGTARSLAAKVRLRAARMVAPHGFGYFGQALSAAEIFGALYAYAYQPDRDHFVCSPGHYIVCAFALAPDIGALDEAELASYGQDGSALEAVGTERSPGVDLTCGSLGQGLSAAAGFALADRLNGRVDARTFVLVSDGELEEGQVWEAALFAAHHKLDKLVMLIDANNSQVDGPVDSITTLDPIADKWRAFGWEAHDVDGHDLEAIRAALESAERSTGRPTVIVCRTSTRHGVDSLPADVDGHFIKLSGSLAQSVLAELEDRLAQAAL
jgi:transketolase